MKLLVLIPVLLIATIAGFNLHEEIIAVQPYYMVMALHAVVSLVCLAISWLIIRSSFSIKYSDLNEPAVA
jgi:hypothetical protein